MIILLIGNSIRNGNLNIGTRPVLETNNEKLLEVYVLDWSGDIYSHLLSVEIMEED